MSDNGATAVKIRQITYSGTYGVVYSDARHDPPSEPDIEADWTLVSAVWQQVDNGYGGHVWRWVWIWEGVRQ